jgi:hypothetical protein
MRAQEVRRAIEGLGRGRTTPIPESVRAQVVAYVREQQGRGQSLGRSARELGLSPSAVQRWASAEARQRAPRLARVRVVADRSDRRAAEPAIALVAPSGYRLEGLTLEQAVQALGRLG